jgi:hypothetical protein
MQHGFIKNRKGIKRYKNNSRVIYLIYLLSFSPLLIREEKIIASKIKV